MAHRRGFRWLATATVGACVVATMALGLPAAGAAPGAATSGGPGTSHLPHISALGRQELAAAMAEKRARTPAQRKLDSHLLYAELTARRVPLPAGLPRPADHLPTSADAQVAVDVSGHFTATFFSTARAQGAHLLGVVPNARSLRLTLPLGRVEQLAADPGVRFIAPAQAPQVLTGSVDSQGDTTHQAVAARSTFGVDGTGVKIGVISDGVASLATSQSSGDLGPVTVLPYQAGPAGADEGTAMLQIIHDVAPGATLYFATGSNGDASFAQNILDLRAQGCQIIVDDLLYLDEPVFQDGPVAQAVDTVTAAGALYFSAAGNSGSADAKWSGTWEGNFVPYTDAQSGITFANFAPPGAPVQPAEPVAVLPAAETATLQWSDPFGGSGNDYDLYLFDAAGNLTGSSTNYQTGYGDPLEGLTVPGGTAGQFLVVVLVSGSPRFLHLTLNGGRFASSGGLTAYTTGGATYGHSAAAAAISVAAAPAAAAGAPGLPSGPYPNAFSGANVAEPFSSDGPRRIFFNPDGSAITPGNLSATGGSVLAKPDLTAADGVSTTVTGFSPFYGTSAAAPHAAAVAALMIEANPGLTPAQVRTDLAKTAFDIEAAGWDRDTGYGIVDALSAVRMADGDTTPPTVTSTVPASGAPAASPTAAVSVTLSERVQPGATLTLTPQGGSTAAGTTRLDPSGRVLTFTPSSALWPYTRYTATVSGVKDLSGNAMAAPYTWTFTTGAGKPFVDRLYGSDRFATSAAVSASFFKPSPKVAFVVTGLNYPDALAAAAAAGTQGGPVLLVTPTAIPAPIATELQRLKPQSIVVAGSSLAVSDQVFTQLKAYTTGTVTRVAGADRFATAAALATGGYFDPHPAEVLVATGLNYPDALAGAAVGGSTHAPVLLVLPTGVPAATAAALKQLAPQQITILGSATVVPASVATALASYAPTVRRLFGTDRFATAAAVSKAYFPSGAARAIMATGLNYPDALSGAALAAALPGPVLLSMPTCVPTPTGTEITRLKAARVTLAGGPLVLSAAVASLTPC